MNPSSSPSTQWWSTFFSGAVLETLHGMAGEEQTREEVEFIVKTLDLSAGSSVLDVPCGYGRLSLGLLDRGLHVTGVDIAQELIDEAQRSAGERRLEGRFENREMRDLPWEAEFDAAFCFGHSFGYLDDAGNEEFLRAVRRALKPGGRFLLDAPSIAESILPDLAFARNSWHELGEWIVLRKGVHDFARSRLDVEYTFVHEGRVVERKLASYRVYTYRELARLLEGAGFTELTSFSSLCGEPYETGKPLYLRAER